MCATQEQMCTTQHSHEIDTYGKSVTVNEGLKKIADKFASPDHRGPNHTVRFSEITDEEEQARIERDAYERVNYLIQNLMKW